MKVIKPNNIKIEKLQNENKLTTNSKQAIIDFVKVDAQFVQYSKADHEDGTLLKCQMHPFVQAVQIAYSDHLPLIISPDMIWYLISSAAAIHITKNSEELRKTFVNHQGKKVIRIRRDDFRLNSPNPWHEVIDDFATKISENTNNQIADVFVSGFTTTTKVSRVVSQIVLMDAMQKYFEYRFSTMCGIPELRISGSKEDWLEVKKKADKVVELIPYFNAWKKSLDEILSHFINVFDDKVDNSFWNNIFKISGGSGGPYITGWIIALFPYLAQNKENRYVAEGTSWRDAASGPFSGLTTDSFDYHMNQVPFTWEYFSTEIKMLFIGGLIGVLYEKDSALKPVFGYAVTEAKVKVQEEPQF